ncbi:transferrin-binding protein-like solute binding protein [Ruixingdingia sedimenti]|uniref:Transferrin-binding protein-like solute binding protein n=1 Tax=Ruixingdingia sedimenti TaxID=3073604 RepID=A0ABU1FC66_9RHOB|nr:transferrin-binding protein-like solute binding protein [Xinfangfangia sp. LG-4]MDR5654188.1 transferrin-binding protein-like solute binding protein [Xinfangfangia sp. LG-4]
MTVFKPLIVLVSVTALSACMGGGSDNPAAEYAADSARGAGLVTLTDGLDPTPAGAMPAQGWAEYDGIVGMAFGAAPESLAAADMIGELDLRADFARGTISGELDDFNTSDGREVYGALRLSGGQIAGSGFSANIDGRLTGPASAPGTVSGTIGGDFLGAGADALAGTGTATSTAGGLGVVFRGVRDRD